MRTFFLQPLGWGQHSCRCSGCMKTTLSACTCVWGCGLLLNKTLHLASPAVESSLQCKTLGEHVVNVRGGKKNRTKYRGRWGGEEVKCKSWSKMSQDLRKPGTVWQSQASKHVKGWKQEFQCSNFCLLRAGWCWFSWLLLPCTTHSSRVLSSQFLCGCVTLDMWDWEGHSLFPSPDAGFWEKEEGAPLPQCDFRHLRWLHPQPGAVPHLRQSECPGPSQSPSTWISS